MFNARLLMPIFAAVFAVSACQPVAETTNATALEETTVEDKIVIEPQPPVSDNADSTEVLAEGAGARSAHGMTNDLEVPNEIKTSARYQDYAKAMTGMHDEMLIGIGYNDPDTAFAKSMLGHHRGTIDMAKVELKYGQNPFMRKVAQEVMTAQQSEIDILRKWLASHPDTIESKPVTQAMQRAYDASAKTMHDEMSAAITDPDADMAFARAMLAHHIGAVKLARTQLKYGEDDEMRALAKNIIDAQQSEIDAIQNWIDSQTIIEEADDSAELTENESVT
ncbi:CopM family metallochaperone [Psychrobacter sp. DM8]|uniref:CopM family metallochaperone n=1 Tax=Psychrobacter sp. DM8 TaxID=3440636 RepID=UPI003F50475A